MYYILTKMSDPGWSKQFAVEQDVYEKLCEHICVPCIDEFVEEFGQPPTTIEDLLYTACGCEFCFEEVDATYLAKEFHNAYEELAPTFGYETREDTKEFDPESNNGKLMIAVCEQIIKEYIDPK